MRYIVAIINPYILNNCIPIIEIIMTAIYSYGMLLPNPRRRFDGLHVYRVIIS